MGIIIAMLSIALAQIHIQLGNPAANLDATTAWIAEAARRGCQLVVFPELWSTGYDLENSKQHASEIEGGIFPNIAALARKHRIMVGGSTLERSGDEVYNTFTLHHADGSLAGSYRKIHLFQPMQEDEWLEPGDRLAQVSLPGIDAGLAICYDLRFPELFRSYALMGCQIVLVSAEWPARRIEHWKVLARARAIENQMFIAAVNRVGESKGERFGGYSAVIAPDGSVLAEGETSEGLITAQIDVDLISHTRKNFSILSDRRPDSYR